MQGDVRCPIVFRSEAASPDSVDDGYRSGRTASLRQDGDFGGLGSRRGGNAQHGPGFECGGLRQEGADLALHDRLPSPPEAGSIPLLDFFANTPAEARSVVSHSLLSPVMLSLPPLLFILPDTGHRSLPLL